MSQVSAAEVRIVRPELSVLELKYKIFVLKLLIIWSIGQVRKPLLKSHSRNMN